MSSVWGSNLKLSIFGEAHGPMIGGTLHNFPAGVVVNLDRIKLGLKLRQGSNNFTAARKDEDRPTIISGVTNGITNGAPITVIFTNKDVDVVDYKKEIPRPSHADYVSNVRYNNHADTFGGGHGSGRSTLPIVFFGMLCADYLEKMGVKVVSHIKCIGEIYDDKFTNDFSDELIDRLNSAPIATINTEQRKKMVSLLMSLGAVGNSIGGAVETAVVGLEAGYGSPTFDGLESKIASFLFAIPAVKSVSFGYGARFAHALGSDVADSFVLGEGGKIETDNNYNGGINGGISNGMPILVSCSFKPTPSIKQPFKTLNFETNKIVNLEVKGEHVTCLAPRGAIISTSAIAICIMDSVLEGKGYFELNSVTEDTENK